MITTDHHGPHEGNSGRGTSSGPVSADTVPRASPDLPACYGGRMSADKIKVTHIFHVEGPLSKTTFLVNEVIGFAAGAADLIVYFRGGSEMMFNGLSDGYALGASLLRAMEQLLAGASS